MNHPIEGLMNTAMSSIKDMIDVDTIVGEPISTGIDTLIIPISKVSFGFAAGGSEFKGETINEYSKRNDEEQVQYSLPFGGGSGAGVNIEPVAFLVVSNDSVPDVLNKSGELIKTMKDKNCAIDKLRKKVEDTIEEDDDEFADDENED